MFASLGLVLAASLAPAAAETSEIRINLVAVVPVTCSMAQVLGSEATEEGLRVTLAGNCNTNHVVRVSFSQDASPALRARLNGTSGAQGQQSFSFVRPAYFAPNSLLEIDFENAPIGSDAEAAALVVEVSPV